MSEVATPSAWAPLRIPAFRMLFIAMVVSNIGTWMQMVGAQWLLIDEPNATALIAFIQTAMTLPMALFAMPSGIIADNVDRRRMLAIVQTAQLALAAVLAVLVILDRVHPFLLLFMLFALGVGTAFSWVPFQSSLVELVPKAQMPMAAAMTGISANIARAVGPALAGVIVAQFGPGAVFILNVVSVALYLGAIMRWKPEPRVRAATPEPFLAAFVAGLRYVRHSPHLRRLLTRVALFTIPAQAIWALLPIVARRQLHLGVDAYGVLLGAIGVGAVTGAAALPQMRARWRTNGTVSVAMIAYGVALVGLTFATTLPQAVPLLAIAGFGWTGTLSTVGGSLQVYLPGWVRSRAGAINTIVLFGGQAIGAAVWGWLPSIMSIRQSYWLAAAVILAASSLALLRPLREVESLDRTPAVYWPNVEPALDASLAGGSVLVTIEYRVPEENVPEFLAALPFVRVTRLRTGGYNWQLQRDIEDPERFIESYEARTWSEHMRAHEARLTESDRAYEDAVRSYSIAVPKVQHFIRTEIPRL